MSFQVIILQQYPWIVHKIPYRSQRRFVIVAELCFSRQMPYCGVQVNRSNRISILGLTSCRRADRQHARVCCVRCVYLCRVNWVKPPGRVTVSLVSKIRLLQSYESPATRRLLIMLLPLCVLLDPLCLCTTYINYDYKLYRSKKQNYQ